MGTSYPYPKKTRGTDQGSDVVGGGCRGGCTDRISGLSDDLLHSILLRLPNTAEAARTSILSRRWRRVWAYLPELSFRYENEPVSAAQAHGRVDAALAAHSAAAVSRLEITIPYGGSPAVHTDRVAPWLRFASERLTGELSLSLPYKSAAHGEEEELLLPSCERLKAIRFVLNRTLRFQLPPTTGGGGAHAFMALATLEIKSARVDGRELECFVSTCCPSLKELVLECVIVTMKDGAPVLSIRSDSLRRLETIGIIGGLQGLQLQVAAPELESFSPHTLCNFHVAAPSLSELIWYSPSIGAGTTRHHFTEAGRHLRRLVTSANLDAAALMRRFDIVDELDVTFYIAKGRKEYERYLENINNLSKCQVLVVRFTEIEHSLMTAMLHLLMKCVGIRKLVVHFSYSTEADYPCKSSGCPCGCQEKTINNVALDSLEEIEVNGDDSGHKMELVRLLCKCSAMFRKRMAITVHTQSRYMRGKIINSIRTRNNQVELKFPLP